MAPKRNSVPHFFMMECLAASVVFILHVQLVDDTVGQTDNRYMNVRSSDNFGDGEEDITCRNNYVGTVRLQAELFHTFFYRERFQSGMQFLQRRNEHCHFLFCSSFPQGGTAC